ncbi:MAG TPA: transcription antitermination factor NusB [Thermoanaerobaculia bacterium]|nr:transcription antitermination factor NusB [Thermoanaerobaculia bacterium]
MSGKRHTAREMAVQMLYQHDLGGSTPAQVFAAFDLTGYLAGEGEEAAEPGGEAAPAPPAARREEPEKVRRRVREAFDHARALVEGAVAHREEIDRLIRTQADNWRLERMPAVDRNILRLAVFELLHQPDVPKLVVLDEAIELAKKYGSEQSSRFINGLLDGLLKQRVVGEGR